MVWLLGCNGMLGTDLSQHLKNNNLSYIGTDKEIDITNIDSLRNFTKKHTIEWIINCAAYTAVDKAEDNKEICRMLNTEGPRNIGIIAKKVNAKVIHISTDYVFNGMGNKPYKEDDITDPIGVYGLTKRDGENALLEENNNTYIIRIAWLYGKYGNNFVNTMLKLMKEKESIKIVNDQKGSPTWTDDLAKIIINFIKQTNERKTIPYGIYNYTNEGEITWHEFAKEIYKQAKELGLLKNSCEINPCTSDEFPAKVKRPAYSVLDKTKIKSTIGVVIPSWDKSLKEYLNILGE